MVRLSPFLAVTFNNASDYRANRIRRVRVRVRGSTT